MKRCISAVTCAILLLHVVAPAAHAGVNVTRTGDENPMKEVATSVIYGGLAGLVVGGAIAVATKDNSNDGDYLRWGFAGGTFLGLGMGLYWVSKRPKATAALELRDGTLRAQVPTPAFDRDGRARLLLAPARF